MQEKEFSRFEPCDGGYDVTKHDKSHSKLEGDTTGGRHEGEGRQGARAPDDTTGGRREGDGRQGTLTPEGGRHEDGHQGARMHNHRRTSCV
jgi:hypothetical protein